MSQDTNPVPEESVDSVLADMDTIEVTLEEATPVPTDADEIKRLTEALARAQADYQNLLMRVERDKADMVFFLSGKILSPLLAQIDNLTRAVALKAGTEGDTFVDGLRSVLAGFDRYLESQGVRSFASLGAEVDPDRHDVMTQMPGEEGKIIQEFEKGYTLGDRVLRHAKVVVGIAE
jgi:molecular chaperone GrpE